MVPLVINQNKKFDQFNFKNYLIQTCKQHREEGRALAFAFIIYDFENHTISEILEKRNYWNSLDKISGKKLSIFYVNSNDSYFEQTQEKIYQAELQQSRINSGSDTFSFLVPITRKPTQTDNAIEFAKNQFNIDGEQINEAPILSRF